MTSRASWGANFAPQDALRLSFIFPWLVLLVYVPLAVSSASFAQQAVGLVTIEQPTISLDMTTTRPVSDSLRQAVHRLLKWSRLYGTIGAVSGGLLVAGATSYIARGDDDWQKQEKATPQLTVATEQSVIFGLSDCNLSQTAPLIRFSGAV